MSRPQPRFPVRVAISSLLVLACLPVPSQAQWPGWLGPNRDGKSADQGLLKAWPEGGPKLLWKADNIGIGFSNVAVSDGTVYASGDRDGKLLIFAFDLDGKLKWEAEADAGLDQERPGSRATPTIDGGRLYFFRAMG